MAERVYIGIGCNLGNRERQLDAFRTAICRVQGIDLLRISSAYDSAPVGPSQPRFLNAVADLECSLAPQGLLSILQAIEATLGRARAEKWGPRAMDLDILLWGERVIADANLQVPHPELHRRRFVLEPLAELAPSVRHPLLNETMHQLLQRVLDQDVVRWQCAGGVALTESAS